MTTHSSEERITTAAAGHVAAEQLHRAAEELREVGEAHRCKEEEMREAGERRRESAEIARCAAENQRGAVERLRNEAMLSLGTTAESLAVTLRHMEAVEQLRRALRDASRSPYGAHLS